MVKPARTSLGSFAPTPADGARVEASSAAPATSVLAAAKPNKKPSSVTVYLPRDVVKTLKLIALEDERRLSDICAEGITEWLRARGHLRGEHFKA